MTFAEVLINVEAFGGTLEAVQREADHQARHVGSTPFNNMIRALQLFTWQNNREDWIRLAGAMLAKKRNKKGQ